MSNKEIAKIFHEIAEYLDMDKVSFKPQAYERAALALETLPEDVAGVYKRGGINALEEIPGIGKSIGGKIEEYLKTGRVGYYEEFKKRIPVNLEEIVSVEGLGPKRARMLYEDLKIRNLEELEKEARAGRIKALPRFGEKTEKSILQGIAFLKRSEGRFLLGEILPQAKLVYEKLKSLKEIEEISLAGSVRRRKETIGDLDFLAISDNPSKVMDYFLSLPGILKVWGKGATKTSVRMRQGYDMDIRVVPKQSYGSALQYFTGSKEHNIALRRIAIDRGLKLSEYGLFRGRKMVATRTEEEVYESLGLQCMEPELRENQGEIEAALAHRLPKIIGYSDIKGDLHVHSNWNGGSDSIEDLAEHAMRMGYEYLGISDHTKYLRIESGLDEKKLLEQRKYIAEVNNKFKKAGKGFRIIQGCEANILKDGSIDIKGEVLSKLDYVIAGIHSGFKMDKQQMTERIIRAIRNPNVDIIPHPTGRILKKRDEYQVDFERVLKAAKEYGKILEINSYPDRLDLNDVNIRRAKDMGVKMTVDTDSHQSTHLRLIEFGISQARRGWAEKKDIINAWPLKDLLKYIEKS